MSKAKFEKIKEVKKARLNTLVAVRKRPEVFYEYYKKQIRETLEPSEFIRCKLAAKVLDHKCMYGVIRRRRREISTQEIFDTFGEPTTQY